MRLAKPPSAASQGNRTEGKGAKNAQRESEGVEEKEEEEEEELQERTGVTWAEARQQR